MEFYQNPIKTYVFGIGTGRCGTVSLSNILSSQPDSLITHELKNDIDRKIINWNFNQSDFFKIISHVNNIKHTYCGSVGFYLINYIDSLVDYYKINNCKIIIIQRNLTETVDSYIKKTEHIVPRNHWSSDNYKNRKYINDKWDIAYPKYDISDKKLAIQKYYTDYYDTCEKIKQKYPTITKHIDILDLNNNQLLYELLSWIGYADPNIIKQRKHN